MGKSIRGIKHSCTTFGTNLTSRSCRWLICKACWLLVWTTAVTTTTRCVTSFELLSRNVAAAPRGLLAHNNNNDEDLYAAVHRKEYEMKQFKAQHMSTTDPIRMAMSYAQESVSPMRLAAALRRVQENHDDDTGGGAVKRKNDQDRQERLAEHGLAELGMRRASFVVDIKRKSAWRNANHNNNNNRETPIIDTKRANNYCRFDDAGAVAAAMVRLGADAVFINTDYVAYGGDCAELKSAVRAVRAVSKTAAVVMKDLVVDEIQLGIAKEAGADGVVVMASVLGAALDNFLDLATMIGLETIVECHTRNEVQRALDCLATNIMINNYDRLTQTYYPQQAIQLAGMFPGSGGPIICLATGGIETTEQMKRHLAVGYDGVVVGKAVMGSPAAPEFIRAVRDRTLLPAEMSQWGIDAEFDMDGNLMPGLRPDLPSPTDANTYQ
jgi:indole-3-glycerol phosphate synthase